MRLIDLMRLIFIPPQYSLQAMREEGEKDGGGGTTVLDSPPDTKKEEDVKQPRMWHVLLLNDDYTPFDVVVEVIREVFSLEREEAIRKMMVAHAQGRVWMGTYVKDMAETKAQQVPAVVKKYGDFPLKCDIEEAPAP